MPNFYVTFGQKSPFRDGYVLVQAADELKAREAVVYAIGHTWCGIYTDEQWMGNAYCTGMRHFFKMGQLGHILIALDV